MENMNSFFKGEHWDNDDSVDSESQETLVVNYARVVVIKYAALLTKGLKINVPSKEAPEMRQAARRREAFLMSLLPDLRRAYRRAEFNACKLGFGVIGATFVKHAQSPEVRTLDTGTPVHEYSLVPGQGRSVFQFKSVKPVNFFPVFTNYEEPANNTLYYVIVREEGRLTEEVQERYGKNIEGTETFDSWPEEVEDTVTLLHYWDKKHYVLVAEATVPARKNTESAQKIAIKLFSTEHLWGRPPYWIIQNLWVDDEDPTWLGTASDIEAIAELNRRFNEMLSEQATEARIHIHQPLVYSSDDHQQDPAQIGFEPNMVIPIGAEERLEGLRTSPISDAVDRILERYRESMNDQSFLNDAAYGRLGSQVTGVGVRLAQASMEQLTGLKLPEREDAVTNLLGSLLWYAEQLTKPVGGVEGRLLVRAPSTKDNTYKIVDLREGDIAGDYTVQVTFDAVLPYDRIQNEQNEIYKWKAKAIPLATALQNMGVDDVEGTLTLLREELQDVVLNPEHAQLVAMAKAAGASSSTGGPGQKPLPDAAPSTPLAMPRSTAPTVPSTAATPNGANVPSLPREMASAGANFGADMGFPTGPGINMGPGPEGV